MAKKIKSFFVKAIGAITDAQMRRAIAHIEQMKRNGTIGGYHL